MAEREERARVLVEEELQKLSFLEKGILAAYLTDERGEETAEVARALYLNPDTSAVRRAKWLALTQYPCEPGECHPGCAHNKGRSLWEEIRRRVLSKL